MNNQDRLSVDTRVFKYQIAEASMNLECIPRPECHVSGLSLFKGGLLIQHTRYSAGKKLYSYALDSISGIMFSWPLYSPELTTSASIFEKKVDKGFPLRHCYTCKNVPNQKVQILH